MRTVVIMLAVTLLLGVCAWLRTRDSIRREPGRDQVARDVPAVVVPKDGSARVATFSAPTTALPDKPVTQTTVPTNSQAGIVSTAGPSFTSANPSDVAVRQWLIGELVQEGLSESDSKRILRGTYEKISECELVYRRRRTGRLALRTCVENVVQESGVSEAYRRLAAKIRAANQEP